MSTLQQQMQLYHAIETALRGAADTQQPMTLGDIWEVAQVKESTGKQTHVRDKLKVLLRHKLIHKVPVAQSQSGSKMSKVGYMWAQPDKSADDEILTRSTPGKVKTTSPTSTWPHVERRIPVPPQPSENVLIEFNGFVVYVGEGVEMHISDVTCKVDKNPETGMVRIKIE